MQINDFREEDLFGQIEGLVSKLEAEQSARVAAEAANAGTLGVIDLVSRKLRPPMESVTRMAERILSGPLSLAQRRDAQTLSHSMHRILNALSEVLDYRTLESGEAEFQVEAFDLHALVREAASALQAYASARGLTSSVDIAANCPRFIMGDAMRVRQVLMALLDTSIQSTSEGSIRLYASINDAATPITVRFDITDTSPGLSATEQANLFEPSTDLQRPDGGLGLPIARRIAMGLGGGVSCDSALGQGTLYWFTFQALVAEDTAIEGPAAASTKTDETAVEAAEAEGKVTKASQVSPAVSPLIDREPVSGAPKEIVTSDLTKADIYEPSLSEVSLVGVGAPAIRPVAKAEATCDTKPVVMPAAQPRAKSVGHTDPAVGITQTDELTPEYPGTLCGHVLVIEDNTVSRFQIGAYLKEFGLTFEMAECGIAGLKCLDKRPYDLVLMDTVLPDCQGVQLVSGIRALDAPSAEVPIVALSTIQASQDERRLVEKCVSASVPKPIQGSELYAALAPLLTPTEDNAA